MGEHEKFVPDDGGDTKKAQKDEVPEGWWECGKCGTLNRNEQIFCTNGDYSRVTGHNMEA